jgi:hypothetical protein
MAGGLILPCIDTMVPGRRGRQSMRQPPLRCSFANACDKGLAKSEAGYIQRQKMC